MSFVTPLSIVEVHTHLIREFEHLHRTSVDHVSDVSSTFPFRKSVDRTFFFYNLRAELRARAKIDNKYILHRNCWWKLEEKNRYKLLKYNLYVYFRFSKVSLLKPVRNSKRYYPWTSLKVTQKLLKTTWLILVYLFCVPSLKSAESQPFFPLHFTSDFTATFRSEKTVNSLKCLGGSEISLVHQRLTTASDSLSNQL